ncbi:MAG: hypothetical protein FK730_01945 [Asgard group archaeon]|nr:hypothetical protein [Asgard group archaeon]
MPFVFLISLIFFSFPQQVLHSANSNIPVTSVAAVPATNLTLSFSTFLGGSEWDFIYDIAVTDDGSCYVTGLTGSSDFPTKNAFDNTFGGYDDVFLTKFAADGSLLWSTYLGGSDGEYATGIAVTEDGSCYVIGCTWSANFPTKNAYDSTHNGWGDVFVSKFSSDGSLLWSTFLGGSYIDGGVDSSYSLGIAIIEDSSCYVTGTTFSDDFPTQNAFDSTNDGGDAFLTKFAADGSLLWSTFLGGSDGDFGKNIATAGDGSCYVTGYTTSNDFPMKNAYDNSLNGESDFFITKFSSDGLLLWSTYLGGSGDFDLGQSIAVTTDGSCYVTGFTTSNDFPVQNAFNSIFGGSRDVIVSKFTATGTLLWSTFLGGTDADRGYDIAVTSDGSCYVTGETRSSNFPMKNAYDNSLDGRYDVFITKFSTDGFLLLSSYLGGSDSEHAYGIAVTKDGRCFVTGYTDSNDFPILNAYDTTNEMYEGFVTVLIEPQSSAQLVYLYGILAFMVITLLIVLILYIKRK